MAGLNYGRKYRRRSHVSNASGEGVSYAEKINKWIVRVKVVYPTGQPYVTTIAQFKTEIEANEYFNNSL